MLNYDSVRVLKLCWSQPINPDNTEYVGKEEDRRRYEFCRSEMVRLAKFLDDHFGYSDQYACDLVVGENQVTRYERLSAAMDWVTAEPKRRGDQTRPLCLVVYSGRALCDEACLPRQTILLDQESDFETRNDSFEDWHRILARELFPYRHDVLLITNSCHTDVELDHPFHGRKNILAPSAHNFSAPDPHHSPSFFDIVIEACKSFPARPFTIEALFERIYAPEVHNDFDHGPRLLSSIDEAPLRHGELPHPSPSICLTPKIIRLASCAIPEPDFSGRLNLSTNVKAPLPYRITRHRPDLRSMTIVDPNSGGGISTVPYAEDHQWEDEEIETNFIFIFRPSQHVKFPGFIKRHDTWFMFGRVFSVLWPDSQSRLSTITGVESAEGTDELGAAVSSIIRHFVVIQTFKTHVKVLPVMSYDGKFPHPGIAKTNHSLVYADADDFQHEQQGHILDCENGALPNHPIRVFPSPPLDGAASLPLCWIDFGQSYTFSLADESGPGLQARPYAIVSQRSVWKLAASFAEITTTGLAPEERAKHAEWIFEALKTEFHADQMPQQHDDDLTLGSS